MIAAWMLYALFVSASLAAAGFVLERTPAALRRPRRWIWAGAMIGSVAIPAFALLGGGPAGGAAVLLPAEAERALHGVLEPLVVGAGSGAAGSALGADSLLLVGWAVVSLVLLGALARGHVLLARRRRRWRPLEREEIDAAGPPCPVVRMSADFGPAVVGVGRGEVVVPAWVLELPPSERSLILLHETEHLRSGDARLLAAARFVAALVPWLLPLWWQLHRLRLAIEMDCDERVLGRGADPSRYGRLLLEVGRRRTIASSAIALAEPNSHLERRIRAMIDRTRGPRHLQAVVAALCGAALLVVACEAPAPPDDAEGDQPATSVSPAPEAQDGEWQPAFVPQDEPPRLVNGAELSERMNEVYAEVRGEEDAGGFVTLNLFVDEQGEVSEARVRDSSGREELDRAALDAIRSARFEPASYRDEPVGVWVTQSMEFQPGS